MYKAKSVNGTERGAMVLSPSLFGWRSMIMFHVPLDVVTCPGFLQINDLGSHVLAQ